MAVAYDKYYQTEHLFGEPYPELIDFFSNISNRGKLLDLGCGQGRDAIPIAKLGYEVIGIDHSAVGIEQLNLTAQSQKLNLTGLVADIYKFQDFADYNFILLGSMFHLQKAELKKETELVKRIISKSKKGALIVFCIHNSGKKIDTFNIIIADLEFDKKMNDIDFKYTFKDEENNHSSETKYKMIVIKK